MAHGTCSLEGCTRTGKITYGWCQPHYRRWKKHGDPGPVEIAYRSPKRPPGQVCSVDGCGRGGKLHRGWCGAHYARWRDSGDIRADVPVEAKFKYGDTPCSAPDCKRRAFCRDLCTMHYQRLVKTGTTAPRQRVAPRTCSIEGCSKPEKSRRMCPGHYIRERKHGDPFGSTPRYRMPRVCSIDGCGKRPVAREMCSQHHARWRTHGDPHVNLARQSKRTLGLCEVYRCREPVHKDRRCEPHYNRRRRYFEVCAAAAALDDLPELPPGDSVEARFLARVDKTDSCWLWTGVLNDAGYGMCPVGKRLYRPAHRVAWMLAGRKFIVGHHLDHLCRVRRCVNPDHLDQVTPAVNSARGMSPAGVNYRKTHCKRGHEFDLLNTYYPPSGHRHCRACREFNKRRRRSRSPRALQAA